MNTTRAHHYYYDSNIFAYECEHIFRHHWWLIGTATSFNNAGDYLALNLMKWPLIIVRDQQSKLSGFYNLCRHRVGPLARC
ncbi:MAG: hypothetical protein GY916_07820 [Gammaproteobacteria bacterium]|nr:hypothetical protein [Gammaproteobacteria bacterium]